MAIGCLPLALRPVMANFRAILLRRKPPRPARLARGVLLMAVLTVSVPLGFASFDKWCVRAFALPLRPAIQRLCLGGSAFQVFRDARRQEDPFAPLTRRTERQAFNLTRRSEHVRKSSANLEMAVERSKVEYRRERGGNVLCGVIHNAPQIASHVQQNMGCVERSFLPPITDFDESG